MVALGGLPNAALGNLIGQKVFSMGPECHVKQETQAARGLPKGTLRNETGG